MIRATIAILFLALAVSTQAQIIIPSTMVTFSGESGGVPQPGYQLSITYEVTESAGLYTYSYGLATTPGVPILSFSLGGTLDPIDTQTAAILSYGKALPALSGITGNSIAFGWGIGSDVTSDTVSYTSTLGPTMATFTVNDDDIVWTAPPPIPAPTAPVPEASTLMAGAMMILPLGVGLFRAIRKQRTA